MAKDRIWARLALWMTAKSITEYVPDSGGNSGTIAIPIPLLRQLKKRVAQYEEAHGGTGDGQE